MLGLCCTRPSCTLHSALSVLSVLFFVYMMLCCFLVVGLEDPLHPTCCFCLFVQHVRLLPRQNLPRHFSEAWLMREFVTGQNLGRWKESEPQMTILFFLPRSSLPKLSIPTFYNLCHEVVQSIGQVSFRNSGQCFAVSDNKVRAGETLTLWPLTESAWATTCIGSLAWR